MPYFQRANMWTRGSCTPWQKQLLLSFRTDGRDTMYCLLAFVLHTTANQIVLCPLTINASREILAWNIDVRYEVWFCVPDCSSVLRPTPVATVFCQCCTSSRNPGRSNIYFVLYLVVDSQDIVLSTWIHCPFLRPVKLRWRPIANTLAWLLLAARVVEANPGLGPGLRQVRKFKFLCGVCSAFVKSNQCGVQCECGYYWLHARCIGMDTPTYKTLQTPSVEKSLDEALPFFSVSNSDSIFDCSSSSSSSSSSISSVCNSTHPQLPIPPHLTFLNMNCRSLLP